ncbi:MAG: efflux RND transporter periplasmic adaptor subunit [candidate division Zixibacteria bacterium]
MASSGYYPKLRSDLVVSEQETGGQKLFVLKDPITFRYFRVREPEFYLINQFNGNTDNEIISKRMLEKFNLQIPPEAIEQFGKKIDSLYFFEGSRSEYEISAGRYKPQTKKSLFSKLLFVKIKAFNPEGILNAIYPIVRFLFHPVAVMAMILFILAGFLVYSANFYEFRFNPTAIFSLGSLLTIFIVLALVILLHEFAHSLTCRHLGGQVREMGFLLLYFQVCFYSNLSDSWLFKKKSHRLAVIWAGLFFQMVLFAASVLGWRVTVIGTDINHFFWLAANINLLVILVNFNPLIKLDGYYLLSEIVNIPNLRDRSFQYLKQNFKKFLGVEIAFKKPPSRQSRIMLSYFILASFYSLLLILIVGRIVYRFLVENLAGGGFILFLALLIIIFHKPAWQFIRFVTQREVLRAMAFRPRNIVIFTSIFVVAIVFLFIIPFQHQVGAGIIIQPKAEFRIVHQSGQGRLDLYLRKSGSERMFSTEHIQLSSGDLAVLRLEPLVKEGDLVKKGDTLATIISSQVSSNLDAARAEMNRLQNELALIQSPPKPEEIASAQAAVNATEATVEQMQKDVDRNKSLFEKKLIARQEMEHGESLLEVAGSNLKEAQARLELIKAPPKKEEIDILESKISAQKATIHYLTTQEAAQAIVTPIDGVIVAQYRDELLFKVADMSQAEITMPITDNFLELVRTDADVSVKVRSFPSRLFNGQVTQISNSGDLAYSTDDRSRFPVYALLDNPDGVLKDGMSGYAKISCGKSSLFSIISNRIKSNLRVEFWSWW